MAAVPPAVVAQFELERRGIRGELDQNPREKVALQTGLGTPIKPSSRSASNPGAAKEQSRQAGLVIRLSIIKRRARGARALQVEDATYARL